LAYFDVETFFAFSPTEADAGAGTKAAHTAATTKALTMRRFTCSPFALARF
jgi:hypothetical protein